MRLDLRFDKDASRREGVTGGDGAGSDGASYSLGSTGSLSSARTPKAHSCTRRSGS
jgi:hypothetical protein